MVNPRDIAGERRRTRRRNKDNRTAEELIEFSRIITCKSFILACWIVCEIMHLAFFCPYDMFPAL